MIKMMSEQKKSILEQIVELQKTQKMPINTTNKEIRHNLY